MKKKSFYVLSSSSSFVSFWGKACHAWQQASRTKPGKWPPLVHVRLDTDTRDEHKVNAAGEKSIMLAASGLRSNMGESSRQQSAQHRTYWFCVYNGNDVGVGLVRRRWKDSRFGHVIKLAVASEKDVVN